MRKKLFILIGVLFLLHLFLRIYEYRTEYLTQFNPDYWKQKYENSQWGTNPVCGNLDPHINPHTCVWDDTWHAEHQNDPTVNDLKKGTIGDDGLYTYAGWAYIHGHDPTTLNAEVPPFGKYLIGLSEVLFKNQNVFSLLSGIFALTALFFVSLLVLKDKLLAFMVVTAFSFEPLFYTQLRAPYLDTLYLGLFLMTLFFFIRKKFIFSSVFLGLMAATKSAASTFPLVLAVLIIYLIMTKKYKELKKYLLSLPIAGLFFLLTYGQYFLAGHTFFEFLGVQKWIINFYAIGAKGLFPIPWEMIFTGRFHSWWGEVVQVNEWHIGWGLLLLLSIYAVYHLYKERNTSSILLIAIWIFVYLIFLSIVPTWPRYLLLLLPFMYNLAVWVIYKQLTRHRIKKKA